MFGVKTCDFPLGCYKIHLQDFEIRMDRKKPTRLLSYMYVTNTSYVKFLQDCFEFPIFILVLSTKKDYLHFAHEK